MNLHGKKKSGIPKVMDAVQKIMAEKLERQRKKGRLAAPIRVMVVGIPNVGKSTFINMLAGRAVTKVADRPGVTRGRQWIAVRPPKGAPRGGFGGFDLLDTPGILWPKFEEQSVGIKLALTGAISDNILDRETLATHLLSLVDARYFTDRYKLQDNTPPTLDAIAHARGFKQKGNTPDILRTAITLIDEFRAGKLGRISLETPLTL
jgi:ribosome biogenesis GTPase A